MNGTLIGLLGTMALAMELSAATTTIGRWSFNSVPPDGSASTGSAAPSVGTGVASLVGGATGQFVAGSASDPGSDNSAWNTAGYPAVGSGNKSAGVQFRVSTRGYTNIVITWEQRVSAGASRYARFQYSLDGINYLDATVVDMRSNNTFYAQSVSLATTPGTDDNPDFAFRIVTEFEKTATGAGAEAYVTALGGAYASSGTIRFDVVSVSGNSINAENTPPSLQPIPDLSTVENQPIINHPIQLSDLESPADQLAVHVLSSNPALIPAGNVVIAGAGLTRLMSITPAPDATGESSITLTVLDGEGLTASQTFTVEVVPLNAPPVISTISHQRLVVGAAGGTVSFVVNDTETPAENLDVVTSSSDPALVSNGGLIVGGTGSNRTLSIQPNPGAAGTALISIQVTDGGGRSARTSFVLMVVPFAGVVLYENFGYSDGSLVTNSARFWETHSGTSGQVKLTGGEIGLGGSQTEDLHVAFPGSASSTGIVYVSFQARFSSLPSGNEYFAHLNYANSFRARVFPSTNQAAPGTFRLGIGNNGASGIGQFPADLALNATHTVVIRYEIESARSSLWVDPAAETDAPAIATDTAGSVSISGFSFRNAAGIGTMRLDNLMVGRTFADVQRGAGDRVALQIAVGNGTVTVSWPSTATGFRLQGNSGTSPEGWMDEPGVPGIENGQYVVRLPRGTGMRLFRLVK